MTKAQPSGGAGPPGSAPLPPLRDGSIALRDLVAYAREFDTLAADPVSARDFMEWVKIEMAARTLKPEMDRLMAFDIRRDAALGVTGRP